MYKTIWYCRWDGKQYKPIKETDRDGFCCPACKMAHHRAYNKYVTTQRPQKKELNLRVTQKKGKI